jgi:hypothetical protein
MTKEEIRGLVDEGFELNRKKKAAEERLLEIAAKLKKEAGDEKVTFVGSGCQAVIGRGQKLISQVPDEKTLAKLRKVCGEQFEILFKFAPVQKFKDVAAAIFGKESAKAAELETILTGKVYQTCEFQEIAP